MMLGHPRRDLLGIEPEDVPPAIAGDLSEPSPLMHPAPGDAEEAADLVDGPESIAVRERTGGALRYLREASTWHYCSHGSPRSAQRTPIYKTNICALVGET